MIRKVMAIMGILTCICCVPVGYNIKAQYTPTAIEMGAFDSDGMAAAYTKYMEYVDRGDKVITFNINSNGGSVFGGLELIKLIEDTKKLKGIHTICIVDTHAYSMGVIFLESYACDERYATERSTLLFHNASADAQGNQEELRKTAKAVEEVSLAMANLVCARLKITLPQYLSHVNKGDWLMGYKEALDIGAIDGVISSRDLPPRAP